MCLCIDFPEILHFQAIRGVRSNLPTKFWKNAFFQRTAMRVASVPNCSNKTLGKKKTAIRGVRANLLNGGCGGMMGACNGEGLALELIVDPGTPITGAH